MIQAEDNDELSRTDVLDRASGITMRATAEAERAVRALNDPQSVPDGKGGRIYQVADKDGVYPIPDCVNPRCGDVIPLLRLKMGRIRCVHCQELLEPRKR